MADSTDSSLVVYHISDPSARYGPAGGLRVTYNDHTTVGEMRRHLAERWGVIPAERLRLRGVSSHFCYPERGVSDCNWDDYCFGPGEILPGGSGDAAYVSDVLRGLSDSGRIESDEAIGVVILPAVEVDDSSGSDAEEDGDGPPRPKRARRDGSSAGEDGHADGEAGGGDERADGLAAAAVDADDREADEPTEEGAEEDTGDEDAAARVEGVHGGGAGADAGIAIGIAAAAVGAAGEAAAPDAAAGAVAAPANDAGAVSPLRLWLRGLEVDGVAANRFERYATAFEREFASLDDLSLVPEAENGWGELFEACGVGPMGDKLRLRRAIQSLPRPK